MSRVALTFDVDWAPDFVVEAIADDLAERGVRATWLVTHDSPVLARLRSQPELFELGIHPNVLPGSTHGSSPQAVLDHLLAIVPEARAFRAHGLFQWGAFLQLAAETSLEVDLSPFLPGQASAAPARQWFGDSSLLRLPYGWSDDHELVRPDASWDAAAVGTTRGLEVLDFHPMLVHLDVRTLDPYIAMKRDVDDLTQLTPDAAAGYVEGGGVGAFLRSLLDRLPSETFIRVADAT